MWFKTGMEATCLVVDYTAEILEIYFNDGYIQNQDFENLHSSLENIIQVNYSHGNFHWLNKKLHNLNGFAVYDPNDCSDLNAELHSKANFYVIYGIFYSYEDYWNHPEVKRNHRKLKLELI